MIDRWLDGLTFGQLTVLLVFVLAFVWLIGSGLFFLLTYNVALSIICGSVCVLASIFFQTIRVVILVIRKLSHR